MRKIETAKMRKFVDVKSVTAEEMTLGVAIERGLVTIGDNVNQSEIDLEEPGYRTITSLPDGRNAESWMDEYDFNHKWSMEIYDDEFGWAMMATLSQHPAQRTQGEFQETQMRYVRLRELLRKIDAGEELKDKKDQQLAQLYTREQLLHHVNVLCQLCHILVDKALAARVYIDIDPELADYIPYNTKEAIKALRQIKHNVVPQEENNDDEDEVCGKASNS